MRKFAVFSGTLFISILLAGIYGIIHDQITFTISPEYFSKFKYQQFHIGPAVPYRLGVTLIGFLATWWTGIFIGLGVGLTGLIFNDHKSMRNAITKAIFLVMLVTVITGILGFLYGKFVLANERLDLWHPDNPVDKEAFIIVGSIHNFSYLGGLIGLVSGII